MDWWEVVFAVGGIAGIVGEFWIYDKGLWWHEPKTDRRNWTPLR